MRQVRFHPASQNNTHVVILTSDNCLRYVNIFIKFLELRNSVVYVTITYFSIVFRLYNVADTVVAIGVYTVGQKPTGVMPGTKSFLLGLLGETAVDFDFGPPELDDEQSVVEDENSFLRSKFDRSTSVSIKY